jgi:RNA polymerase sigma factor (sigma-70 family)
MRTASVERMAQERDRQISEVVERERSRLRNFIRRRVADAADADDLLQDVLTELVEAHSLLMPIDHVAGWLFRVARNRIIDLFRRKRPEAAGGLDDLAELLPASDAGPAAAYARTLLVEELASALDELPPEQREAFVAHELEGRSFKEIAETSGVNVNTLLSRKRYAVLHLRERLRAFYEDLSSR